jgi:hypothetical protein
MEKRGLSGPTSLFRHKVRQPVSITLTKAHHEKLRAAMERLNLSRSDVIGLLVDVHADSLRVPADLVVLGADPERLGLLAGRPRRQKHSGRGRNESR